MRLRRWPAPCPRPCARLEPHHGGPWASQVLADLGADVIKVERRAKATTRGLGAAVLAGQDGRPTEDSGYFLSVNRGKRSITVDLASGEGQQIVRALAARSDILLENFKVDTLARYGLGYADLKAVNPGLIYASISGFGQTGPMRQRVAYDFMIQAMGGLMSVTGESDGRPGGGHQKVECADRRYHDRHDTTVAVLAALARRTETGAGDYIDIAMLDVQVAFLANQSMNYLLSHRLLSERATRTRTSSRRRLRVPRRPIALACGNDGQFARLCEALGIPELAADERFASNAARVRHLATLTPRLSEAFATRTMGEWSRRLAPRGAVRPDQHDPCRAPGTAGRPSRYGGSAASRGRDSSTGGEPDAIRTGAGLVRSIGAAARRTHSRDPDELGYASEDIQALAARGVV